MERKNKTSSSSWVRDKIFLGMTFSDYLKSNLTLSNAIFALILIVAIPTMIYRLVYGLGPSTNLTDANPWGIWIGVDVLCGIVLAAGGLVMGTMYYLFGMREYHHFVRPAILTSLLGDLGEQLPGHVSVDNGGGLHIKESSTQRDQDALIAALSISPTMARGIAP